MIRSQSTTILMHLIYIYFCGMDIGSAIAVFLVLALLMLALFCFITKYFHYKLKRNLEEKAQVYSMVDEFYQNADDGDNDGIEDEKYKPFKLKQEQSSVKNLKNPVEMEMVQLKTPLRNHEDLYKPSQLRQKLNNNPIYSNSKQQSARSVSSLKSFRPDKMNSAERTARQNNQDANRAKSTKHTFIHKLVCYNQQGLIIIEVTVKMIRKISEGNIKESKSAKLQSISNSENTFIDRLEIQGFEETAFGCYKYQTSVEVADMKADENYMVKSLKTSEMKAQISQSQFLSLKKQLVKGD